MKDNFYNKAYYTGNQVKEEIHYTFLFPFKGVCPFVSAKYTKRKLESEIYIARRKSPRLAFMGV